MIIQQNPIIGEPVMVSKKPADPPLPTAPDSIELRIRRLEEAVAGLQDTRQMEERVAERISEKLGRNSGHGIQESASFLLNASRHVIPGALGLASETTESFSDPRTSPGAAPRRASWLFEAYDDLRAMVRMYFDHRYRRHMTWTAFLTPFVFLGCILLVWFWMPTSIPLLGPGLAFLDKVVDVVLAFFAYKILSRELGRYRQLRYSR